MRPDPIDWATWIIDGVAVVVSTGTAILFWYRRRGSRHWPIANGTVEYGFTSDASGWQTNLVYSYSVNGDFYSGTHALKAKNEAEADELARSCKQQNVVVRYSPHDPSLSVIRMDEQTPLLTNRAFKIG